MATSSEKRIIAHIDLDSFYASAEISRDQSLKDKPVIIGADPKNGSGRGVVLTCDYIARKFGVRSAMPISQAWKLCPQATYIPPDFPYYELLSERVMRIVRSRAPRFEQVSIDEAFVDLSDVVGSITDAAGWVRDLKLVVLRETGLTCSVGVAENKSVAKIATDLNKPDGISFVEEGKTKDFLKPLPVKAISGVGAKTEVVLNGLGIKTVGDLQNADEDLLRRRLGKLGPWLRNVALGLERESVEEHETKSLSTERTFDEDVSAWPQVESALSELSSDLTSRALTAHLLFRRVGVKIRFQGFETHTRESTLPSPVRDAEILRKEAVKLLKEFRSKPRNVRLVGLKISGLAGESAEQSTMMSWLEEKT